MNSKLIKALLPIIAGVLGASLSVFIIGMINLSYGPVVELDCQISDLDYSKSNGIYYVNVYLEGQYELETYYNIETYNYNWKKPKSEFDIWIHEKFPINSNNTCYAYKKYIDDFKMEKFKATDEFKGLYIGLTVSFVGMSLIISLLNIIYLLCN